MLKNKFMKSTLKIDYERGQENPPVIKIIIPDSESPVKEPTPGYFTKINDDEDVRDKLLRDFLHSPGYDEPNSFFEVKTSFPVEGHRLTTIGPIKYDRLFYVFKHAIINTIIPYDDIIHINTEDGLAGSVAVATHQKIKEFFDYIDWMTGGKNS